MLMSALVQPRLGAVSRADRYQKPSMEMLDRGRREVGVWLGGNLSALDALVRACNWDIG